MDAVDHMFIVKTFKVNFSFNNVLLLAAGEILEVVVGMYTSKILIKNKKKCSLSEHLEPQQVGNDIKYQYLSSSHADAQTFTVFLIPTA